jgi:hypothetical protein
MDLYETVFRIQIQLNGLKNMFNGNPCYQKSRDFRLYHNLVSTADKIEHSSKSKCYGDLNICKFWHHAVFAVHLLSPGIPLCHGVS